MQKWYIYRLGNNVVTRSIDAKIWGFCQLKKQLVGVNTLTVQEKMILKDGDRQVALAQ